MKKQKKCLLMLLFVLILTGLYGTVGVKAAKTKVKRAEISAYMFDLSGHPGIMYSWSDDISGYEIYRKTSSDKKWVKIKTIKKPKSTGFGWFSNPDTIFYDTKLKAKAGSTVCYKARAYVKNGGKVVYGSFSKVLKIKSVLIPCRILNDGETPAVQIRSNIITQKKNDPSNQIGKLLSEMGERILPRVYKAIYFTDDAKAEYEVHSFIEDEYSEEIYDETIGDFIYKYKDTDGNTITSEDFKYFGGPTVAEVGQNFDLTFANVKGGFVISYASYDDSYWKYDQYLNAYYASDPYYKKWDSEVGFAIFADLKRPCKELETGSEDSKALLFTDNFEIKIYTRRGNDWNMFVTTTITPNDYTEGDTSKDWAGMLKKFWKEKRDDIVPQIIYDFYELK